MPRRTNALEQFQTIHRQLVQQRDEFRARLARLDEVLGNGSSQAGTMETAGSRISGTSAISPARDLGMREAIQQAVGQQPLGVREIVIAIEQIGFRFKSKNPYNSVGAYLYGKEGRKYFSKANGKFSAITKPAPSAKKQKRRSGTRRLSAAGRKAIAEAARKRWAKYNASKAKR